MAKTTQTTKAKKTPKASAGAVSMTQAEYDVIIRTSRNWQDIAERGRTSIDTLNKDLAAARREVESLKLDLDAERAQVAWWRAKAKEFQEAVAKAKSGLFGSAAINAILLAGAVTATLLYGMRGMGLLKGA